MPITAERLTSATQEMHRGAEANHRRHGYAAPAIMLIPADGTPHLAVMPQGLPEYSYLKAIVRHTRAVAMVLTGEFWVSAPQIRPDTRLQMPFDDLVRPEDDPQRREAILTTGVGVTADGPDTVLNISMIERGASGSVLRPAFTAKTVLRADGTAAYLASLLT